MFAPYNTTYAYVFKSKNVKNIFFVMLEGFVSYKPSTG
jgi:hypothetical protein